MFVSLEVDVLVLVFNWKSYLFAQRGMLGCIVQVKAFCGEGSQWKASTQCPPVGQGDYPWNCLPDHMRAKVNEAAINNHLGKSEKRYKISRKAPSYLLTKILMYYVISELLARKFNRQNKKVFLTSHFFVLHLIITENGPVAERNWISPSKSSFSCKRENILYVARLSIWTSMSILNSDESSLAAKPFLLV